MEKNDLEKICPYLVKICWMAIEREEFKTAKQLVVVIQELPQLEKSVLKMLLRFIDISGQSKLDAVYEVR